jgi:hypothetical protein
VTLAASAYEIVLALHIMAVVIAFGGTFAYPIMFAIATRADPKTLPVLHRIEYTTERILVNGGLVFVAGAGVFLAADGHHWSEFFVQWGIGATVLIGGLVGAVMIPAARRAEELARRDLQASSGGEPQMSEEYRLITRRRVTVGSVLYVLVLATIAIMAIKP